MEKRSENELIQIFHQLKKEYIPCTGEGFLIDLSESSYVVYKVNDEILLERKIIEFGDENKSFVTIDWLSSKYVGTLQTPFFFRHEDISGKVLRFGRITPRAVYSVEDVKRDLHLLKCLLADQEIA